MEMGKQGLKNNEIDLSLKNLYKFIKNIQKHGHF